MSRSRWVQAAVLVLLPVGNTMAGAPDPAAVLEAISRNAEAVERISRGLTTRLPGETRSRAASIRRSETEILIGDTAYRHGLNRHFLRAMVAEESGFNPKARSPKGAIGLMQLMPGTARELGVDPWDPKENLDGGARYIRGLLLEFQNPEKALWAYNAGPSRVKSGKGIPRESRVYAERVIKRFERYEAAGK